MLLQASLFICAALGGVPPVPASVPGDHPQDTQGNQSPKQETEGRPGTPPSAKNGGADGPGEDVRGEAPGPAQGKPGAAGQGTGSGSAPQSTPQSTPQATPQAAPQRGPAPGSREAMWPAPSEEDWAKPTLIQWQRTWEDAVAVSKETGRPIMVAVNMDGEIASEHYAGIRYRDPAKAKFFEPYVSVIASVYRHNPRDYDESGNRIPCPRFGCVTCGEHIAMEPIVYSMYLDETRVAPRHIGVELDGTELYDVFYAFDIVSVFEAIDDGIQQREDTTRPDADREKTLDEMIASRRQEDRAHVERTFVGAKVVERKRMLGVAAKLGAGAPVELLRMALFGLDVEVASQARLILAEQRSEAAVDLIAEALAVPMPAQERELLLGALEAMGETYPRARSLSVTLRGLSSEPSGAEVRRLAESLAKADTAAAVERYELEARIERAASAAVLSPSAARTPKEAAAAELERSEATLRLAVEPANSRRREDARFRELGFKDAREAALQAERALGVGWRSDAVIGLASHYLGDTVTAKERVLRAFTGMTSDPASASTETAKGWIGMATLSLFADFRVEAIGGASRRNEAWPKDWMTETNTAFDLLSQHPLGTEDQVAKHHDFLVRMGAAARGLEVLSRGLERFEGSWNLHARLRDRLLRVKGVAGMEAVYDRRSQTPGASATAAWYAGYAHMVAGEFRRRRAQNDRALVAYESAIEAFDTAILRDETTAPSSSHYAAMAIAGLARVDMERGNLVSAANRLLASFERWPTAANALDGLNASAVTTSALVMQRLRFEGLEEDAARLQAGLDGLAPEQLRAPDFETPPDTPAARNRDRQGRQRDAGAPDRGRRGRRRGQRPPADTGGGGGAPGDGPSDGTSQGGQGG